MRRILVTGANKGIGLAIARAILAEHHDTFVFLGTRERERGEAALQTLASERPELRERALVVELDVGSDASVSSAVEVVRQHLGKDEHLAAIVNNAGVGTSAGVSLRTMLNTNTAGIHRVCEAFVPLLVPERGRIVNITSASGPSFVAECSEEMKRFFLDAKTEWSDLETLMKECVAIEWNIAAFQSRGLGKGDAYGLSKACANTYTLQLARRHPKLAINACTPGFIETDMTRSYATSQNKTPAELGMKTPDQGARAPLYLLFGELEGNGRFYGSDSKRSPLDRYRAPGSPAYPGE
jgi:NAD(P)-dependent dehydrogenase (short-subunit alcohol dehydrogenase family)